MCETGYDVLVSDDDASIRDLMVEALRYEGYTATSLPSHGLTSDMVKKSAPKLLILDLQHHTSRSLSGLIQQLACDPATCECAILLTSTDNRLLRGAAGVVGRVRHATLIKPFELDLFFGYVNQFICKSRCVC